MEGKSVLLVDDEQIILDGLRRDLESEDFQVTAVKSGEEAIAALQESHFDCVITDLMMTGLDGLQVLREAKKHSETSVIILTGYGDMNSTIDALRLGADDFLQKPCDSEELLHRITSCLTRQELQKKVSMYERIVSICSYCNKIRDTSNKEARHEKWLDMKTYFQQQKGIDFLDCCCPECYEREMKTLAKEQHSSLTSQTKNGANSNN